MSETCKTCRFFWGGTRMERPECRRRAPVVNQVGNSVWPPVLNGHWCGEYESTPAEPRGGAR